MSGWWIHVDKNAIAANDADGGTRPTIVVSRTTPHGTESISVVHEFHSDGPFRVVSQQRQRRADRPHVWIEGL